MNKKVVLLTDELGKPIRVLELKEYRSHEEIEQVIKACSINEKEQHERQFLKEKEYQGKIAKLEGDLRALSDLVDYLYKKVKYLSGEEDFE